MCMNPSLDAVLQIADDLIYGDVGAGCITTHPDMKVTSPFLCSVERFAAHETPPFSAVEERELLMKQLAPDTMAVRGLFAVVDQPEAPVDVEIRDQDAHVFTEYNPEHDAQYMRQVRRVVQGRERNFGGCPLKDRDVQDMNVEGVTILSYEALNMEQIEKMTASNQAPRLDIAYNLRSKLVAEVEARDRRTRKWRVPVTRHIILAPLEM